MRHERVDEWMGMVLVSDNMWSTVQYVLAEGISFHIHV